MGLKTIAWDVDDVLNDLMAAWLQGEWRVAHPECALPYEGIVENPPHRILGITRSLYLASLDGFRLSPLARDMTPVPEVVDWFVMHGASARHVALTATPMRAAASSAHWVFTHFGAWIRTYHVVPSVREGERIPRYDDSKAQVLEWWGRIDVLVDDDPVNVAAAKALGVKAVLFPRPWNGATTGRLECLETIRRLL